MPREGDRTPRSLTDWLGLTDAPRWCVARPLGVALSVAFALLFVLALVATVVVLVRALADGEGGGLGVGALLVALLGAPFLIWSTVIRHETLRYQKEGHITDRIAKAVEQLGAEKTVKTDGQEESRPNIEVRIGAILSLERIAQDSTRRDNGRDHVRVMEILCAYVRENAPAGTAAEMSQKAVEDDPPPMTAPATRARSERKWLPHDSQATDARHRACQLPTPRADIAMAVHVIGRRSLDQKEVEAQWNMWGDEPRAWPFACDPPKLPEAGILDKDGPCAERELNTLFGKVECYKKSLAYAGYRIDLRDCNLQRVDFGRGDFSVADLTGSRLEGADFRKARLVKTRLGWTRLDGALFNKAVMPCAWLQDASIGGTDFSGASMHLVTLSNIRDASDARFHGTELIGASVFHARLERTDFRFARLEWAEFLRVTFVEPNFNAACLNGTYLQDSLIQGGEIGNLTNVRRLRFNGAAFREIDLRRVYIPDEALGRVFGDASVELGPRARPPHWPKRTLADNSLHGQVAFDDEWRRWRADPAGYIPPPPPQGLTHS